MKSSTFWFLLAMFGLVLTVLGHGGTDVIVGFWACMILSEVAKGNES